jgi:hypothetical protein
MPALFRAKHRQRDSFAAVLLYKLQYFVQCLVVGAATYHPSLFLLGNKIGGNQLPQVKREGRRGPIQHSLQFSDRHAIGTGLHEQLKQFEPVFVTKAGKPFGGGSEIHEVTIKPHIWFCQRVFDPALTWFDMSNGRKLRNNCIGNPRLEFTMQKIGNGKFLTFVLP